MFDILKKQFVFIFFVCFPSLLFSQTGSVFGYVYGADSVALSGVVITVKGTTYGAVTNKNGYYKIDHIRPGTYMVHVSLLGYETLAKEIVCAAGDNPMDLDLKESNIDLNEVVITGTKTEKALKDVPVITQVIKADKMFEMGVTNLTDALQKSVPGLDVSQLGTKASVTMQGLNANYVLFLIDGERIAGEMNGDIDYSRLSLDNIDRIEVIKGAASSLYGSNAIGGVINIITKKITQPVDAKIYSRYSKYNESFSGVGIGVKKGIFGSRTSFNYNRTDGYDLTPESPHDWAQNPYTSFSVNQKFEVAPSSRLLFVPYVSYYQFERGNVSARPVHDLYNDLTLGLNGTYYFGKNEFGISYYRDRYNSYDVLEQLKDQRNMISYDIIQTIRAQGNFYISEKNSLTTGMEYNYENLFSERIEDERKHADEAVLYAQDDIRFAERWNLVLGIRASNHSIYGIHAAPKISILYKHGIFNYRASAGFGFRSPTLKELYMDFDHLGEWRLLGNPLLEPESSTFLSGSVEYLKPWNNSSITVYRNNLTNMINANYWLPDTTQELTRMYQNIASAYVYGVDLISRQKIGTGFWLNLGYSYVYSRDNQTDLKLYGSTKNSGNIAVDYNFHRNNYSITAQLSCKLMGKKFYDTATSTDKPYANWIVTVSQEYKWFRLTTGIDNVFGVIRRTNYDFISPGRRFFVGFSIDLSKIKG
jgi:outer membrane receptor for ferrienterochelin and colicins